MLKYMLVAFFFTSILLAQEQTSTTYNHGYNGIELIVKNKNGSMIIISTFNSKKELKEEIAQQVYNKYKENKLVNGAKIKIESTQGKVTGKCTIQLKGNLTTLNFYFEIIEWGSGLIEIYKKT